MAGHSRWAQIKHKKVVEDARRSQLFAKLSNEIEAAARLDQNPTQNPRLASLIEEAKRHQFPKEKITAAIERAKSRASGDEDTFWAEAYGPGGMALLIGILPHEKDAVLGRIKKVLGTFEGKLAQPGEVRWQFGPDLSPRSKVSIGNTPGQKATDLLAALRGLDGITALIHNALLNRPSS